ncbi:unnamed protein product [Brassica napus]|uniref:(rape) hypothetical protein n=1 Tax=Brassica napus TaxID=3708 RepID=A0A816XDD0_BRANA|nr:unnamed protein product [Brassica napus]
MRSFVVYLQNRVGLFFMFLQVSSYPNLFLKSNKVNLSSFTTNFESRMFLCWNLFLHRSHLLLSN